MRKKRSDKDKTTIMVVLVVIVITSLGILLLKKPSITGFAVISKESSYSDNL